MITRMLMADRISWGGGQSLRRPVDIAEMDEFLQPYGYNDLLTAESKTFLDSASFTWKLFQVPLVYPAQYLIENKGSAATINLRQLLVRKANRAVQIGLVKMFYGVNLADAADSVTVGQDVIDYTSVNGDNHKQFQSARQALTHDATYGHITRTVSSNTNTYWQGRSLGDVYTDQATSRQGSIDTFRKMVQKIQEFAPENPRDGDYLCVVGPDLHLKLKTYVERFLTLTPGPLVKYGFKSFMIDNIEVAMDYRLQDKHIYDVTNSRGAAKEMWFFHVPSWELRFHPERAIRMTKWTWQGDRPGGIDMYLARILAAGNFVCWQPNLSALLTNVT